MSVGTTQSASGIPAENSADPSMEDILASIRRILSDDETPPAAEPLPAAVTDKFDVAPAPKFAEDDDDVLVLEESMIVTAEPPAPIAPPPGPPPPVAKAPIAVPPVVSKPEPPPAPAAGLMADATESAAVASVSQMMRSLNVDRQMGVYRGGPTLEDMVLDTMRPLLKAWLDQNLPPMVERLVRNEIERVAARALSG